MGIAQACASQWVNRWRRHVDTGRQERSPTPHATPYLHSDVDGFSRLSYTEPLADEKGVTAAKFFARAEVWFAAHGVTHIHRVVTDNGPAIALVTSSGSLARIRAIRRLSRTPHDTTEGRALPANLAEELLYARESSSEDARSTAIAGTSTTTTVSPSTAQRSRWTAISISTPDRHQ